MSEIDKLKSAADILQQVDITDMISNMGIGIARAQEQLDNNSVKQALALADPATGFGGKSLLELGFVPAFYSFQFADISAEIELKMRLATGFEVGGELNVDFTKQGGYSKEKLDFLRKDRDSRHREEFKSTRSFLTTSSNTEELTILTNSVKINTAVGSIDRVQEFTHDIRQDAQIDRATVEIKSDEYVATDTSAAFAGSIVNAGGYTVITIPEQQTATEDVSILKLSDYTSGETMTYTSSKEFVLSAAAGPNNVANFDEAYNKIHPYISGTFTFIGFESATNQFKRTLAGVKEDMELFFELDDDNATATLEQSIVEGGVTKDNTVMKEPLLRLAQMMKEDNSLTIKIIGHTDGTASDGYNLDLSKRRSASLKEWFVGQKVPKGQIEADGLGESIAGADQNINVTFRKVSIEITSTSDYFYLKAVTPSILNAAPVPSAPQPFGNGFVYLFDASEATIVTSHDINFDANSISYALVGITASNFLAQLNASSIKDDFSYKVIDNSAYLLHEKATLKYVIYSNQQEEITFRTGSNKTETFEDTESKYLVDDVSNTSTRIKEDSEKINNPSTVAVGVSIDGRTSRQFSIDVSGNARIAARLVSMPAPSQFLEQIKDTFNQ